MIFAPRQRVSGRRTNNDDPCRCAMQIGARQHRASYHSDRDCRPSTSGEQPVREEAHHKSSGGTRGTMPYNRTPRLPPARAGQPIPFHGSTKPRRGFKPSRIRDADSVFGHMNKKRPGPEPRGKRVSIKAAGSRCSTGELAFEPSMNSKRPNASGVDLNQWSPALAPPATNPLPRLNEAMAHHQTLQSP